MVTESTTPMMQQYLAIKAQYQDCLLFFRMGDFYELFFDDATEAALILSIALTKRGKHAGQDIPMCGVPVHSYAHYLHKLIKADKKVAICEQLETPEQAKKRGYKAIVERNVVRVITPGTIVEESLLEAKESHYLACIGQHQQQVALAWCDMSTSHLYTLSLPASALGTELARLLPKELIMTERFCKGDSIADWIKSYRGTLTTQVDSAFALGKTTEALKRFYAIQTLDGLAALEPAQISACGVLLDYIQLTQKQHTPHIQFPTVIAANHHLMIDAATRRSLELTRTISGTRQGSLLDAIDRTVTAGGARLLEQHLSAPLATFLPLVERQEAVGYCIALPNEHRTNLRRGLAMMPDIERLLTRLSMQHGAPRDLVALRLGLKLATELREVLLPQATPPLLTAQLQALTGLHDLIHLLEQALEDEVGLTLEEGNFIRLHYSPELDHLRLFLTRAEELRLKLRDQYREQTGVANLKIEENAILGMYIEVTPQHSKKLLMEPFIHRQSLASAIRFTTQELQVLEAEWTNARSKVLALETQIFEQIVATILTHETALYQLAQAIATIDVLFSHAELAVTENYVRPQLTEGQDFHITKGRHPVLAQHASHFVANDCRLEQESQLWLVTGPNMAGKSTFLRQNALLAILAQTGCYIPAASATIGLIDAVFSRVGAADDLAQGRSTFMVEMIETAAILNQATHKSLLILDEVGRGTATYDGMSIAWAVLEHIHQQLGCRGLFATHYHELTLLSNQLSRLACYHMRVQEWQKDIVFYYEVAPGAATASFGLHVAKLAGIPRKVVSRAEEILASLSEQGLSHHFHHHQLPLFAAANMQPAAAMHPSVQKLREIIIDDLSPRDAHAVLYALVESVQDDA